MKRGPYKRYNSGETPPSTRVSRRKRDNQINDDIDQTQQELNEITEESSNLHINSLDKNLIDICVDFNIENSNNLNEEEIYGEHIQSEQFLQQLMQEKAIADSLTIESDNSIIKPVVFNYLKAFLDCQEIPNTFHKSKAFSKDDAAPLYISKYNYN
jgi:hypothetical protein